MSCWKVRVGPIHLRYGTPNEVLVYSDFSKDNRGFQIHLEVKKRTNYLNSILMMACICEFQLRY